MDYDLNLLKKYFDFVRDNENFHSLPNETAEDLELDLVFLKLDNTASKIGKQYFFTCTRRRHRGQQTRRANNRRHHRGDFGCA